jgi:PAS domain S-box-containing protein
VTSIGLARTVYGRQLPPASIDTRTRNIVSSVAGAVSLALGTAVLVGWFLDVPALRSLAPGFVGMKANASICFVLLGVSLLVRRRHAIAPAIAVTAIALLTLVEYGGVTLGLDELLVQDHDPLTVAPGRMAINTCGALACLGAALLLVRLPRRTWSGHLAHGLAGAAAALAWRALVGYASGIKTLYGLPGLTPIAPHTAFGVLVVAVGVIALRPRVGFVGLMISRTAAGTLTRRLGPIIVAGPAVLAWARHMTLQHRLFSSDVGDLLFVSGLVALLLVALIFSARAVRRIEEARAVAEEARRHNEETLDRFFTLALELLCIADLDGYLRRVNPVWESTLGWSSAELMATPFIDFVHPDDREATLAAVSNLAEGQAISRFENRYRCRDGSYRWLQWSSAMAPADGLVYASARDVTERRETEEALQQLAQELEQRVVDRTADLTAANEELEAFAYSVSHDLRAPLRGIDGFSQALLEEYSAGLDATGRDYLARVRAGSQRMGHLIDDILSLSRVSRAELLREDLDLSALVSEIASELRERHPEREVELVIPDAITASGDVRFVRIALENLLSNAFKFTARRPTARIEFGRELHDGVAVYFVRDDGVGFDMAYADQLFVPFHRLHAAADFPGSGIGLVMVRRIARRHGGRAWAQGEVGRGATVYFTLGGTDAEL